jgi:hypothetical protein
MIIFLNFITCPTKKLMKMVVVAAALMMTYYERFQIAAIYVVIV